ncbi:unnamed protein product [Cochlearia groenlandica]
MNLMSLMVYRSHVLKMVSSRAFATIYVPAFVICNGSEKAEVAATASVTRDDNRSEKAKVMRQMQMRI